MFQSRRFCDSYRLGVAGGEDGVTTAPVTKDGPGSSPLTGSGRCDPESTDSIQSRVFFGGLGEFDLAFVLRIERMEN